MEKTFSTGSTRCATVCKAALVPVLAMVLSCFAKSAVGQETVRRSMPGHGSIADEQCFYSPGGTVKTPPDECVLNEDNNGASWPTCNARFYDSGGPDGNINATETIWAEFVSPAQTHIKIEFESFNVNGILKIYDGLYNAPDRRLIGQFHPSTLPNGALPPTLFSSQHAISVEYVPAQGDVQKSGWEAAVSCVSEWPENPVRPPAMHILHNGDEAEVIVQDSIQPAIVLIADFSMPGRYANDYTVESIPYEWQPETDDDLLTLVPANQDDKWLSMVPLPFKFIFFGETYEKLYPSSNGLISFNPHTAGEFCDWNTMSPFPSSPPYGSDIPYHYPNCIYLVYEDTDPRYYLPGGYIKYGVIGQYPCRTFVFDYKDVGLFSCHANGNDYFNTYRAVLYEGTNIIDIYIKHRACCTTWNQGHGVIGLQNKTSSQILTVPGRDFSQNWTADEEGWRFAPVTPLDTNATVTWYKNAIHTDSIVSYGSTLTALPEVTTLYIAVGQCTDAAGDLFVCSDSVLVYVPEPGAVGIDGPYRAPALQCTVCPNPTADVFRVVTSGAGGKAMEAALIDNGGRTIRTQKVSGRTFDIQAADLPAGVYFVRLTDGRSSCIAKVVKR